MLRSSNIAYFTWLIFSPFLSLKKMNIPAYMSPMLRLGRTFHPETCLTGHDIFPEGVQTVVQDYNIFSFKCKVVKSSKELNELLDISSELSLKIKADLLQVEGTAQFIKENNMKEETNTLLAVMKCTTVKYYT